MISKYKDSGIEWIGEIPEDWSINRTKHFFTHHKDIVGENSNLFDRLALTLKGVIKRSKDDSKGLQPEAFNSYQILRKNDLVFKLIDLENISTSRVGLCPFIEGIVSPAYIILTPNDKIYPKYGEYYYLSMWHREIFNHLGDDGVRSSLNVNDLLNIPILIINKEEQQKIAEFLDKKCSHIDSVLDKTKASIEEYKKLKQAVITQAVTKGIRPNRPMKDSGIEWIGEIPEDWRIKRLRYIGNCQNGISKGAEAFGSGYPFISYSNVYRNIVLPEIATEFIETTKEERELYSVQVGDVFFTRTSETIEEIGFSSVCEKTIPNATFAGFLIRFRPYNKKEIIPKYSKYYFRANIHRAFFVKEMNLVTRASLGQGLLKRLPVILPNIQEQEEIADYLDIKCAEIDKLIEKKEQLISELETYKKSLIYEYVTGKKEVC